ncbi:hypothetical protein BG011_001899 [Mortierella polycephala]|uniref:DUF6589 domain-containing protein n=1 Tax=Mortierella polycephala TaxID=41804 RepID=A0A9P6Q8S3_9FUNG|nr:hypothetical protein BG011_001899 [Mortierella polycephala]
MARNDYTFKTFLLESFVSDDRSIRRKVSNFYNSDGSEILFDHWWVNIKSERLESIVQAAIRIVLVHTADELENISSDPELRLASTAVIAEKAGEFKLQFITDRFKLLAPNILLLLDGLTSTPSKDSSSIVPTIAGMLAFHQNRSCSYLQMIMGLYLFNKGAAQKLVDVLNHTAVSVSYRIVLRGLDALTKDANEQVKNIAQDQPWYIVYDNIKMAFRKYDQRLSNQDSFDSGATATVVISESFGEEEQDRNAVQCLCQQDLMISKASSDHMLNVFQYHLTEVFQRHFPQLNECSTPVPVKKLLPVKKTNTFPLPAMHINQATVQGNKEVLQTIMEGVLNLPGEWFHGKKIFVAGDQLTVSRIRSLKKLRCDDISTYHRLEWATPVVQLFHLRLLWGSTILRTHYGNERTPGSLASIATLLRRKRVNLDKPDFHATDELLRHTFDAMAMRAWEEVLDCEDLGDYIQDDLDGELNDAVNSRVDVLIERYLIQNVEAHTEIATKNAALLLRDLMLYMELSSAIKAGDVGRIEEVIKWLTILFQAGSTKNYAIELLHLHTGLMYSWSDKTREAVLSLLLVNTTGQPNRYLPADLYQEHNILLTKTIHAAKGSNASWESLGAQVSGNIRTFNHIAEQMEKQYNVPYKSTKHAAVSAESDITQIPMSIREGHIFRDKPQPSAKPVKNLFEEGMNKLTNTSRIEDFISGNILDQDIEGDVEMEGEIILDFDLDSYIQITSE